MVSPAANFGELEFVFPARCNRLLGVEAGIVGVRRVRVRSHPKIFRRFILKKYPVVLVDSYSVWRELRTVKIYFHHLNVIACIGRAAATAKLLAGGAG